MATTGNGGPPPSPSAQQTPAQLSVLGQYIKDFSFENPNAPQSLVGQTTAPAIEVGVNVGTRNLAPNVFEVTLALNGTAKRGDQTVFIAELSYAGVFTLQGIPEEHVRPVLLIRPNVTRSTLCTLVHHMAHVAVWPRYSRLFFTSASTMRAGFTTPTVATRTARPRHPNHRSA